MSWLRNLFRSSSTPSRDLTFPHPWEVGKANPVSVAREVRNVITFSCPTCAGEVSIPVSKIDDLRGALWGCRTFCRDQFRVQGPDPQRKDGEGLVITSGVLVAIEKFGEWYIHHPAYAALGEESWMLNEHGLWAFRAACGHQIISTVLCAFANYQLTNWPGMSGPAYVFGANSGDSAHEMKALQAGRCQGCGCKGVIAIMTTIPEHLREDYRR